MNLVVLDGYTLNPGDLSWDNLQQKGNLTVYDRTPLQDIVERAKDAEAVFTNKVPYPGTLDTTTPRCLATATSMML